MLLDQNIQNNEKMLDLENAIQQINAKDRINNIAKSMDAVKQEINTIRDRFYSDIECNTKDIKELKLKSENQEKVVKENSDTLKHITKDSIGKIKDVSSNCLQIEKNIRSIKDKSERFEAKIEWMQAEIKGLGETHGTLITEIQQRLDYIKDDKMNSSKISDSDLAQLQNSVKSVQTDLKNLIQDKKTMDFEDEERKLSMESSLLDLRNYVENILTETNSQLGSIASEVENSHDKILKCGLGLEELINKYEADKIDYETLFTGMDAKLKEMSDYAESKQLDSIDKILQLRKEFVDKHADYLEMSTNNRNNIDALKSQVGDLKNGEFGGLSHELQEFTKETNKVTSRIEAEIENIHRKHSARFVAIESKHSTILTELNTVKGNHIKSNEEASASFNRLDAEMKTYESEQKVQAGFLDTLAGRLSREERDAANRLKEIKDAQSKMRNEIDTNTKQMDALHKELEVRLDNCRRNLLDIISTSEIKVQELEDRIKQSDLAHENFKILENNQRTNFENKLSDLKQMVSATSASTEKVKNQFSEDAREEINRLKTNFENLKRDVLNLDIAGFKASINNTNTTQNKQLQTLFEGIDALKKEACQHTLTVNKLDGRVASMVSSLDSHKSDTSKHNKTEEDARTKMEERINNLQTNIRELYEKLNQRTSSEDLKKMNQSFELWKKEINEKIQSQQNKIVNVENSINLETSKMKESVLSSINTEQQNTNKQIQLLQKNIQEKSEPLEKKLQQYKKEMTDLESSLAAINTSLTNLKQSVSQDITRTDNLETAFTNIKSQLSAAESNINSYAKDSEVQKLKDTINKMTATKSLENLESKLESMYAHSKTIDLCMGEVKSKGDDMEKEMKTMNIKLEKLKDIQAVTDELKSLENKVNQQKTKVIDVEASVQFQERSIDKLGEDVKKINGSVFGNISNVDDRLSKLDETTENLKSRVVNIEEKNEKLSRDIDSVSTNKNQMDQVNAKVGHRELEKLQSQVNDEVSQLKKNHKHIEDKLESFITTSKKDVESMKTSAKADLENLKKSSKADIDTAIRNLPKQDLSQYTTNSQFKTSISSLQENIDNIQKKMQTIKDEGSSDLQKNYQQIKDQLEEQKTKLDGLQKQEVSTNSTGKDANENLKNSVLSLEKGMKKLEDEIKRKLNSQQENQLSLIDKQRRTWETTREKAEQMSQIFESLIITNDRPYVSCGIGSNIDMAGMIIFNQFELINKIEWEEENGFNLVEPGVYILQISATLANCTLSVKLVSEQLEAELLALTSASGPMAMFKSRSTIFTVEDDDRDAEKIVVDIIEKDSGECLRVDSDLSVIMYKISEVSNSENAGELWRIVDE